tara:strand:- start:534 stop:920 length:387 start_codon:yes stop_codon:yes gene_type:complete
MKKFFFLGLFFLCSEIIISQKIAPEIKFEKEFIDYGKIEPSSEGTRVFTFINYGNAPLIIKNVQSSCGCTIPKKPEDPIDPGKKGEILVRYDTNRIGVFNKSIIVTSNASSDPIITLKITGIVTVKGK